MAFSVSRFFRRTEPLEMQYGASILQHMQSANKNNRADCVIFIYYTPFLMKK